MSNSTFDPSLLVVDDDAATVDFAIIAGVDWNDSIQVLVSELSVGGVATETPMDFTGVRLQLKIRPKDDWPETIAVIDSVLNDIRILDVGNGVIQIYKSYVDTADWPAGLWRQTMIAIKDGEVSALWKGDIRIDPVA